MNVQGKFDLHVADGLGEGFNNKITRQWLRILNVQWYRLAGSAFQYRESAGEPSYLKRSIHGYLECRGISAR